MKGTEEHRREKGRSEKVRMRKEWKRSERNLIEKVCKKRKRTKIIRQKCLRSLPQNDPREVWGYRPERLKKNLKKEKEKRQWGAEVRRCGGAGVLDEKHGKTKNLPTTTKMKQSRRRKKQNFPSLLFLFLVTIFSL
jgi:hypothetical protein